MKATNNRRSRGFQISRGARGGRGGCGGRPSAGAPAASVVKFSGSPKIYPFAPSRLCVRCFLLCPRCLCVRCLLFRKSVYDAPYAVLNQFNIKIDSQRGHVKPSEIQIGTIMETYPSLCDCQKRGGAFRARAWAWYISMLIGFPPAKSHFTQRRKARKGRKGRSLFPKLPAFCLLPTI